MPKYVTKKDGKYWPNKAMKKIAWISSPTIYKKANKNPVKFWENLAKNGLTWEKNWTKAYEEKLPYFKWFKGGTLNMSFNCLDRHLIKNPNKTAIIWIPEPTKESTIKISYKELHKQVCKFANILKKLKIKKGDVVSIYMPMIPETYIAMLSCARIGAIHSVVFSAFSQDALKARIQDGKAKLLITSDGYFRKGEKENLLSKAKKAVKGTTAKKIIVVSRLGKKISGSNIINYNKVMKNSEEHCPPVFVKSEDPMFILYTSGTTGKPKGVVHDTGGYATQSYWTTKWNFNLHDDDVMWCTADVGWITGHTYVGYGPLLNGATTLIYEGSPDFPKLNRWWKIIEKNNVTVFYTAPTAIRMFMKSKSNIEKYKLKSLRILGTVGEPIDMDAWNWYFKNIGKKNLPIIDTWWQTETGCNAINTLPGVGPFIPTVAGKGFPGTDYKIVDADGKEVKPGVIGFLVQLSPFAPGMLHGVYKNHKKYVSTYWKYHTKYKKKYYDTSDGAYEKHNLFRITGRTDDVMKVAGHLIATAELEDAINQFKLVNECAVVPIPDKIKGEVPVAFVILKKGEGNDKMIKNIKKHVDNIIGPTARPSIIYFVNDLPKTRSGKIMRRILKNILNKEEPKGIATLLNPDCVERIKGMVG